MNKQVEILRAKGVPSAGYNVLDIEGYSSYRIGIDTEQNIIFLIKSFEEGNERTMNSSKGRHLDVLFNVSCEISVGDKIENGIYTILSLKTRSDFFEVIFLNVCQDLVQILGDSPLLIDVIEAVESLRELFRASTGRARAKELGLWGELVVINSSSDPEHMIDSWHVSPKDTFDFNDGASKMEVKNDYQK